MQLMLAGTQRVAQRGGISKGGPARRRWRGSKGKPQTWNRGGRADGSRGRSWPPGPSRPLRARRGGRRSGAGATSAGEQERQEELWLGGRRGRRGAGSWLGVGVGRWGRESPPRWHPAPRPHLAGFFPGRGAAAAPPRPPAGVTDALGPPLPTCARRPAAPPCASEAGGTPAGAGSPRPERPGCGDLREGVRWRGPLVQRFGCDRGESAAPAFQDFLGPRGGNKPKNKGLSIGRLLIKHLLLLTPGNGASQALNRNIIEKSMLRW